MGQFDALLNEPKSLLEAKPEMRFRYTRDITPTMQIAWHQILNCPYQGMMKRMYLESKVLELVTLQFAQLLTQGRKDISTNHLQIGDIERIHQAKDTLIKNFDDPPSLMSLARQVGLNHYKLKVGFRQVFGTTVFSGYDRPTSFIAVATTVRTGTFLWARSARPQKCPKSNGSSYSTAFKKRFGVNPRAYRSEFEKN